MKQFRTRIIYFHGATPVYGALLRFFLEIDNTTSAPIDSTTAPSGETSTTLDTTTASGGLGIKRGTTRVYREQMLVHTRDIGEEINISLYQKDEETYIKLRSAADMLGLDVYWNGATGTVELTQRT